MTRIDGIYHMPFLTISSKIKNNQHYPPNLKETLGLDYTIEKKIWKGNKRKELA